MKEYILNREDKAVSRRHKRHESNYEMYSRLAKLKELNANTNFFSSSATSPSKRSKQDRPKTMTKVLDPLNTGR